MALHTGELFMGIFSIIIMINALFWLITHCKKMYQDIYTTDRVSISHRRSPPKVTKIYRWMSWLTTIGVFGFGMSIITTMIGANFVGDGPQCFVASAMMSCFWQIGKGGMFLSYILRLHQCYSLSAFGYGKKKLTCCGVTILVLTTIFILTMLLGSIFGEIIYRDKDNKWPYTCSVYMHVDLAMVVGGTVFLFDFIMTVGSIFAFIVPINRLFKELSKSRGNNNKKISQDKKYEKMLYAGFKYKVIVICASVTSIFWMLILFTGQELLAAAFAIIDYTINMYCLMFMTPYYPDNIYYQRFCCLCICCCDRKKQSYQSNAYDDKRKKQQDEEERKTELEPSSRTKTLPTTSNVSSTGQTATLQTQTITMSPSPNAKSVDTMDALEIVAKQTGTQLLGVASETDYEKS